MTTRLSNEAPREWRPVAEPSADHSPFGAVRAAGRASSGSAHRCRAKQPPRLPGNRSDLLSRQRTQHLRALCEPSERQGEGVFGSGG